MRTSNRRGGGFFRASVGVLAGFEKVELLPLEVLDPGGVGEAEQVHYAEDGLGVAVGVGRVDITLDYVVVHEAVDDPGALPFGGADDQRVEEQMPFSYSRDGFGVST